MINLNSLSTFALISLASFSLFVGNNISLFAAGGGGGGNPETCQNVGGNIVSNCGFETGNLTSWSTNGPSTVSAPYLGFFGFTSDSSNATNTLNQTLNTVAGATYQISFAALLSNSKGTTPNFNVTAKLGSSSSNVVVTSTYAVYSTSLVASSNSDLFQLNWISVFNSSAINAEFDSFSVVCTANCLAVPEPMTWLTMGSILSIGVLLKNRKLRTKETI